VTTRNAHRADECRTPVVSGSSMAPRHSRTNRSCGSLRRTSRSRRCGGGLPGRTFRVSPPGPYSVASPLGFAAVYAPGGPLQGQVASNRRPPISTRSGRVRRRAQQSGTPLVRNRTLLAWRCPDLEAALFRAAPGDRTRGESRQGPDRTRRRNQKRTSP
jgi:hypothetical protein